MSVSGISSSSLNSSDSLQNTIQKEFQQLGQDLQSGNLSAAQSDFATLQSLGPQSNSTSSSQSSNPLAQAFNQLEKALQSGNLSAAQKDFKLAGADRMRSVSYLNSSARNCNLATSLPRNRLSAPCSRSSSNRRHRRNRRIACRLLHDRRNGSGSKSEQRFLSRSCTTCGKKVNGSEKR